MTDATKPPTPAPQTAVDPDDLPVEVVAVRPRRQIGAMIGRTIDSLWSYFGQDAMPRMAAALAYRTIFSLIPLLLLAFLTLRLFQDTRTVFTNLLKSVMDQTGLSKIAVGQESVEKWIESLVDKFFNGGGINFGAIGLVSAATLIYAALSLLVDIESSFNHIYNASRGRSWTRRILQYWLMISLGPLLVYASFSAGAYFHSMADSIATSGSQTLGLGSWVVGLSGYAVTVSISAALLVMIYLTVPNTVVKFSPALMGSLVAGLLLELAKYGFSRFFSTAGYSNLYGSLALLPLFLLWVYVTWFIVLFGLRVSFLIQHGRTGVLLSALRASNAKGGLGGMWIEPARSVTVLVAVAESFAGGRSADTERLAEQSGMDVPTATMLLGRLEAAGLIHRIGAHGRVADSWALSRPAEKIDVADVVEIGQALSGPSGAGPGGQLIARIRRTQMDTVRGVTLASLLAPVRPVKPNGGAGKPSSEISPSAASPAPMA